MTPRSLIQVALVTGVAVAVRVLVGCGGASTSAVQMPETPEQCAAHVTVVGGCGVMSCNSTYQPPFTAPLSCVLAPVDVDAGSQDGGALVSDSPHTGVCKLVKGVHADRVWAGDDGDGTFRCFCCTL